MKRIDPETEQNKVQESLIVVTDLDGTLLDHNTYSYQPAMPALRRLGANSTPVILCSSKTRTEIELLRQQMANESPFIVENGAAICGLTSSDGAGGASDLVLGKPYSDILQALAEIREYSGFHFIGFNDMSLEQVCDYTGLSSESAALAKKREFSEPLVWQDSEENLERFLAELSLRGLKAQQGGRFLTVAGETDKGRAVAALRKLCSPGRKTRVIALGDSPNDEAMLNSADIAVVIKSAKSATMHIHGPDKIIYTQECGPEGWNRAMLELLED